MADHSHIMAKTKFVRNDLHYAYYVRLWCFPVKYSKRIIKDLTMLGIDANVLQYKDYLESSKIR